MTLKTEIEFELSETIAYSRKDERALVFCPGCQAVVEMAVPYVASKMAEIAEREIYRLILANEVHFIEADRLLVCIDSLKNYQTPEEIL